MSSRRVPTGLSTVEPFPWAYDGISYGRMHLPEFEKVEEVVRLLMKLDPRERFADCNAVLSHIDRNPWV